MSYCFNPNCENPQNPEGTEFCLACNSPLLLRNRYRAIELIEGGSFGRTLIAQDADRLGDRCVIKQFFKWRKVKGHVEAMARATQIFEKEARLLLQLGTHPQIPALLACFEQDGRLYLVQEFIEGQNLLEEILQQGAFSEQQIRDLLNDLLNVLQFIHERGVIHRDIKPMNIIRRKREALPAGNAGDRGDTPAARRRESNLVLVDFGLAKQLNGATPGQTGSKYGTEGYAPLEQTRGKVFPASDLYSLGITCIQLLTDAALEDLYEPTQRVWLWREYLRKYGTDVSDPLHKILDKLIQDSLSDRYQSVAEVLKDLQDEFPRWCCIHTLSGHLGIVDKVTFGADGQTVASGSTDNTIKVWHLDSGMQIQSASGDSQGVKFVAISPDGTMAASGSGDSTIQIWHLETEQLLHTLSGHADGVNQVAFTPDGKILVSSSEDTTIKVWQVGTGKLLNTLMGHSEAVRSIVVSPDGKILASGSADKTIKIWHLGSGIVLHTLTEHAKAVNTLSLSPDGQMLASGSSDRTIRVWHLGSGKLMDILWGHTESVRSVAFSPDGQTIASGSEDRTIKIWQRCAWTY